jgi:phosphoribosylformylglycinamidine synthase
MDFVNLYDWPLLKEQMKRQGVPVPHASMNMQLFKNIVNYFR